MSEKLTTITIDTLVLFAEQLLLFTQHFLLFGLLILILFILQRSIFAFSTSLFDDRIIYISAWIGTPIHELSHAFFCVLFGHRIQNMVLFNPDQRGTLGYITHSYNNRHLWQVMGNFFIGIAPLFGGIFTLYLLTYFLLENATALFQFISSLASMNARSSYASLLFSLSIELLTIIKEAYVLSPLKVCFWAYCCAAVSLHLSPSKEYLKGAWVGFIVFLFLCLSLMVINQLVGGDWFAGIKVFINLTSLLYVIGIVLASFLLLLLLVFKGVLSIFKRG